MSVGSKPPKDSSNAFGYRKGGVLLKLHPPTSHPLNLRNGMHVERDLGCDNAFDAHDVQNGEHWQVDNVQE